MKHKKMKGLIAAGFTPFHDDGRVNLDQISPLTDYLVSQGCSGIYACGSTGEGPLLTGDERKAVAKAYIDAAAERIPVFIQVGHNSVKESCELAAHARDDGASAISACSPDYFKPADVNSLVDCMQSIAESAPALPFYYYHIPRLTGADLDMTAFLQHGGDRIPNLAGIKYSDFKLHEFQACTAFAQEKYDILWGCDEMLLGALATGAQAAVGSTYNFAAPIYDQVIQAMSSGDLVTARAGMLKSVQLVDLLNGTHGPILPCMKAVMEMLGLPCGGCRQPLGGLDAPEKSALRDDLERLGFFDWMRD